MINLSQAGMALLLVHQIPITTIEFICSALPVGKITQPKHQHLSSIQRLIYHVLTNRMAKLFHPSLVCSKTGTHHTQWRKS